MKDIKLFSLNWKEFCISDIFEVSTGGLVNKSKLFPGIIPRISASETNNGIIGTFKELDSKNYRTVENFISVTFLGGVFYHPYKASLDMKIHALKIKGKELNRYIGEFLVVMIKRSVVNFSYGNQLSSTDLPKRKIILPVNTDGEPDWDFMEEYIINKSNIIIKNYKENISLELDKVGGGLNNICWKPFKINKILEIENCKCNNVSILKQGKIPYVGATNRISHALLIGLQ